MADYRRKAVPVMAFQYNGQPYGEWPEWLRDQDVNTQTFGNQRVSEQLGSLMLPVGSGTMRLGVGSWVVLEKFNEINGLRTGGILTPFSADDFTTNFEEVTEA